MNSRGQHCIRRRADERGIAMLEFVLMMPFIALILVLIFNFGQGFLERQRTLVTLREAAIRHTSQFSDDPEAELAPYAAAAIAQNLALRGMTATIRERGDAGECPRDGEAVDTSETDKALTSGLSIAAKLLRAFVKQVSSSYSYEIEARGVPLAGALLPDPVHRACFAIDGRPWTHNETGGPMDLIKDALFGLGRKIAELIF